MSRGSSGKFTPGPPLIDECVACGHQITRGHDIQPGTRRHAGHGICSVCRAAELRAKSGRLRLVKMLAVAALPPRPPAPCRLDPEAWFPDLSNSSAASRARFICLTRCPILDACRRYTARLDVSLPSGIHGVQGGWTAQERHDLARRARAAS